jgi:FKBP-type peptidyl-prolyl cis-trans isomerase
MKVALRIFILLVIFPLALSAGGDKRFKGYRKEANASYFLLLTKGTGVTTADTGGAMFIKIKFLASVDTVFMDLNQQTYNPSFPLRVDSRKFAGDFMDFFLRLHVGDSAKFFMKLSLLIKNYPGEFEFNDPEIDSMDYLGFAVKVDSIWSREKMLVQAKIAEEAEAKQREMMEKRNEVMGPIQDAAQTKESWLIAKNDSLFKSYYKQFLSGVIPDANGNYFIELAPGQGDLVDTGMTIAVRYKGYYLDGTLFDANTIVPDELPMEFKVGETLMIPGFGLGILTMRQGGKAKFVIPPAMGYNDGLTRIFEVEIITVTK